jgi:hypothetical protein
MTRMGRVQKKGMVVRGVEMGTFSMSKTTSSQDMSCATRIDHRVGESCRQFSSHKPSCMILMERCPSTRPFEMV